MQATLRKRPTSSSKFLFSVAPIVVPTADHGVSSQIFLSALILVGWMSLKFLSLIRAQRARTVSDKAIAIVRQVDAQLNSCTRGDRSSLGTDPIAPDPKLLKHRSKIFKFGLVAAHSILYGLLLMIACNQLAAPTGGLIKPERLIFLVLLVVLVVYWLVINVPRFKIRKYVREGAYNDYLQLVFNAERLGYIYLIPGRELALPLLGKYQEAEEFIRQKLLSDKRELTGINIYCYGLALKGLEQFQLAEELFQMAETLMKNKAPAIYSRASCLLERKSDPEEILRLLDRAIIISKGSKHSDFGFELEIHSMAARAYARLGSQEAAWDRIEMANKRTVAIGKATKAQLLFDEADVFATLGQANRALELLSQLIALKPLGPLSGQASKLREELTAQV